MLGFLLAAGAPPAALAQSNAPTAAALDERLRAIETDLRALKRQVLPTGTQRLVEPEVDTTAPPPAPVAAQPSSGLADLAERLAAVERAQRQLTSNVEEQGNRLRRLEEANKRLTDDLEFRLGRIENPGAPKAKPDAPAAAAPQSVPSIAPGAAVPTITPKPPPAASAAPKPTPREQPPVRPASGTESTDGTAGTNTRPSAPATADSAWAAAQFAIDSKDWPAAEQALGGFIKRYPKDRRISLARYWLGRSYFNQGRFEESARAHTANYEQNARGEKAQESLWWVGQSLQRLNRAPAACQVYDLALRVYADEMKPELKPQFASARARAGCT